MFVRMKITIDIPNSYANAMPGIDSAKDNCIGVCRNALRNEYLKSIGKVETQVKRKTLTEIWNSCENGYKDFWKSYFAMILQPKKYLRHIMFSTKVIFIYKVNIKK